MHKEQSSLAGVQSGNQETSSSREQFQARDWKSGRGQWGERHLQGDSRGVRRATVHPSRGRPTARPEPAPVSHDPEDLSASGGQRLLLAQPNDGAARGRAGV